MTDDTPAFMLQDIPALGAHAGDVLRLRIGLKVKIKLLVSNKLFFYNFYRCPFAALFCKTLLKNAPELMQERRSTTTLPPPAGEAVRETGISFP